MLMPNLDVLLSVSCGASAMVEHCGNMEIEAKVDLTSRSRI